MSSGSINKFCHGQDLSLKLGKTEYHCIDVIHKDGPEIVKGE